MTEHTLELRNSLQLRLSQKMQQAIKLLQMNHQELTAYIAEFVEQNPFLELDQPEEDDFSDYDNGHDDESPMHDLFSSDFDNYYQDDRRKSSFEPDLEADPYNNYKNVKSLKDLLREQVDIEIAGEDRAIAYFLTDMLEESGYLPAQYQSTCEVFGISSDRLEGIIQKLQNFEPVGVFARSLSECLLIQLREKGIVSQKVKDFLDAMMIHQSDLGKLSKAVGISLTECQTMLGLLRSLNPKPGLSLGDDRAQHVVPDLVIKRKGAFDMVVELNPATMLHVNFDMNYYTQLKGKLKNLNDRNYIQEKFQEGKWLLKSLHQRAMNTLIVADILVRKQADFFKSSRGSIKPLTLKDVALEADLSESTVSRVTTGKYIQTPRGTFELKYFFSSVASENTDNQSAKSVQAAIKKMIEQESHHQPLSDSQIVDRLSIMGMRVARRTIAKYRDILNIDSVSERKRYYEWQQAGGKIQAQGS